MPFSVEDMVRVPRPLNTMSSFENITASVLVSPSAVKSPVTVRVFSLDAVVVIKHLSADTTYIAGVLSFVIFTPSRTNCILLSFSASTLIVQFAAVPEII